MCINGIRLARQLALLYHDQLITRDLEGLHGYAWLPWHDGMEIVGWRLPNRNAHRNRQRAQPWVVCRVSAANQHLQQNRSHAYAGRNCFTTIYVHKRRNGKRLVYISPWRLTLFPEMAAALAE